MWALQSKMGFIIDIRRQNLLTILLHKALFEMSPDRADFVANLFSRRRPAGIDTNTSAKTLMTAFRHRSERRSGKEYRSRQRRARETWLHERCRCWAHFLHSGNLQPRRSVNYG